MMSTKDYNQVLSRERYRNINIYQFFQQILIDGIRHKVELFKVFVDDDIIYHQKSSVDYSFD